MQQRQYYISFLKSLENIYAKGEANAITDIVFESIADIKKYDLIKNPEKELDDMLLYKLNHALNELKCGKPVQYVIGHTLFCGHLFQVGPGVLIPRPETEELVHHILKDATTKSGRKILDIGTGSGCIAISIKKVIENSEVHAIEKSIAALMIAKENAERHDVTIHWHQIDFLCLQTMNNLPVFDIIVSNPPYIPAQERGSMEINVREFEPEMALFVPDNNPLIFYETIAQFGKTNLSEDGVIWVEIHADFGNATQKLFESFGYKTILLQDENEKDRFVRAVNRFR